MEIFNIGIPELIFIFLIMLIFLGPDGFTKTARGLARMIRKLIHSPVWNDLVKAQKDIQELPTRLVREAGIEEIQQEMSRLNQQTQQELNTIRQPIPFDQPAAPVVEPPADEPEADAFDYRAAALGTPAKTEHQPGGDGAGEDVTQQEHMNGSGRKHS